MINVRGWVLELYLARVRTLKPLSLVALFLLGACATLPSGPSVLALSGTGKNFDQFQTDDVACRQFAYAQVGGRTPNQVAAVSGVTIPEHPSPTSPEPMTTRGRRADRAN